MLHYVDTCQMLTFWRLLSDVFLTIGANYPHLTAYMHGAYAQHITTPFPKCLAVAAINFAA